MSARNLPAPPVTTVGEHVQVVDQATGQLVDLRDATDQQLAGVLDAMVEHKRELQAWQQLVSDEVLRRMDASASWTIHAEGIKLTAPSPAPTIDYDGQGLYEALMDLADDGRFDHAAVERAVERVVSYRVHSAALKSLAKVGNDIAHTIAGFATEITRNRSVRVTRS